MRRCEHVTAKPRGYASRNGVRCRKEATHEVYAPFAGIIHAQRCEQHAREMASRYFDQDEIEVRPVSYQERDPASERMNLSDELGGF